MTMRVNLKVSEDSRKQIGLAVDTDDSATLIQQEAYMVGGDYNKLKNKPTIEDGLVEGTKTFLQYGLTPLSNMEIENLLT